MDKGTRTTSTKRSRKSGRTELRKRYRGKNVSTQSRVHHIEQALSAAIKKEYRRMFGAGKDPDQPFTLNLKMVIDPEQAWELKARPTLEEQILDAVQEMAAEADAFRTGRVYCYRCESQSCPHSLPQEPTTVFGGYSSTGLPLWPELSQVLLELKHPQIDLLYQSPQEKLIAAYMSPEMLKRRQLNVFGKQSKTYNILGQVVFGYLRIPSPSHESPIPEPVAFTLQGVESRHLNGTPKLEMNVLGRLSDHSQALEGLIHPQLMRLYNIIVSSRRLFSSLCPTIKEARQARPGGLPPGIYRQATQILRKLPQKLEKASRQKNRRTAHAQEHRINYRPTFKAWDDTCEATDDLILRDHHQNTYVVLGPKNRVHIYSPEGRHVTSFALTNEAVQSRIRRKRWLRPTEQQLALFREGLTRIALPSNKDIPP